MSGLARWLRFNLVGALGMAVQLAALWTLSRYLPAHPLADSAAAVELAILHNFVWHVRYTWRDRHDRSPAGTQLLRFHLANGLVSLAGNVVLMHVLLPAHLPLLAANVVAIACCSFVNFTLSHTWAFAERT